MTESDPQQKDKERCPSLNLTGKRCQALVGHGGMHQAEEEAVRYVWSDETSPALAIDLIR